MNPEGQTLIKKMEIQMKIAKTGISRWMCLWYQLGQLELRVSILKEVQGQERIKPQKLGMIYFDDFDKKKIDKRIKGMVK